MSDSRWWFVMRTGDTCEVQLLNESGAADAVIFFPPGTLGVEIAGSPIPEPVVHVAENCVPDNGQYVDSTGRLLDWIGQAL